MIGGFVTKEVVMGKMKDMFIEAHEELIGEYLEQHPEASEDEAYDKTAELAYDRMTDKLADKIDQLYDRSKYEE